MRSSDIVIGLAALLFVVGLPVAGLKGWLPTPRWAAEKPRVPWEITRVTGDVYRIMNVGSASANDVRVYTTAPDANVKMRQGHWSEVAPGDMGEFVAQMSPGARPLVSVTWRWMQGEWDTFDLPLPMLDQVLDAELPRYAEALRRPDE